MNRYQSFKNAIISEIDASFTKRLYGVTDFNQVIPQTTLYSDFRDLIILGHFNKKDFEKRIRKASSLKELDSLKIKLSTSINIHHWRLTETVVSYDNQEGLIHQIKGLNHLLDLIDNYMCQLNPTETVEEPIIVSENKSQNNRLHFGIDSSDLLQSTNNYESDNIDLTPAISKNKNYYFKNGMTSEKLSHIINKQNWWDEEGQIKRGNNKYFRIVFDTLIDQQIDYIVDKDMKSNAIAEMLSSVLGRPINERILRAEYRIYSNLDKEKIMNLFKKIKTESSGKKTEKNT
ncbi:hypothetical protein [Reichenbachiella sp.]|uniref:hypothetical protein n=1 Tax=Reichenbachiella sp. TaxID=2184521 RepID=UPI00329A6FA0